MRKIFLEDMRRSVKSVYFWITVAIVLLFCMLTPGPNAFKLSPTMPDKSILQEAFTVSRTNMKEDYFYSSFFIFKISFVYLVQYIPLLAALPFVPIYCDERKSGFQRFAMHRASKRKYYFAKISAAVCSAMAAVSIGLLLMLAFCYTAFPTVSAYGGSEYGRQIIESYKDSMSYEYFYAPLCSFADGLPAALLCVLYAALGSAVAALLALFVSSFTANKYIALGAPLLFYDCWNKVIATSTSEFVFSFTMGNLTLPPMQTVDNLCLYIAKLAAFFTIYATLFYFNSKRRDRYGV